MDTKNCFDCTAFPHTHHKIRMKIILTCLQCFCDGFRLENGFLFQVGKVELEDPFSLLWCPRFLIVIQRTEQRAVELQTVWLQKFIDTLQHKKIHTILQKQKKPGPRGKWRLGSNNNLPVEYRRTGTVCRHPLCTCKADQLWFLRHDIQLVYAWCYLLSARLGNGQL